MNDLSLKVFEAFHSDWALVTAGTLENFNTMTIGWGGLGTLWSRDVATVYVKPCRYTHDFMEKSDFFTVSFFPEDYKKDLALLGRKSGRDGDKVAETALTPVSVDASVGFKEASLTILCQKIYWQDLEKATMPAEVIADYYTEEAPHTMYIGEVLKVLRG